MPSQEELDEMRSKLIDFRDKIQESVPEFKLGEVLSFLL